MVVLIVIVIVIVIVIMIVIVIVIMIVIVIVIVIVRGRARDAGPDQRRDCVHRAQAGRRFPRPAGEDTGFAVAGEPSPLGVRASHRRAAPAMPAPRSSSSAHCPCAR